MESVANVRKLPSMLTSKTEGLLRILVKRIVE